MPDKKPQAPKPEDSKQAPTPLTPEEKRERSLALDRFITWGLIFVGVYSVFSGLADYINPRPIMNALFDELNNVVPGLEVGTFTNIQFAVMMGWIAVTAQAVILALVVWLSRERMKAKKMAWLVPIIGAIIANVVSTACIFASMFADPGFQEALNNYLNAQK